MHPISKILCETYEFLLDKGEVFYPLSDISKEALDSTVKTVEANYYGHVRFPTNELKSAAYLVFLIKDHDLFDGNKRLAVLWLEIYTRANGLKINLPEGVSLDALAVAIEQFKGDLYPLVLEIHFILYGRENNTH